LRWGENIDIGPILEGQLDLPPVSEKASLNYRPTIDGYLISEFNLETPDRHDAYTLLFRTGIIEAAILLKETKDFAATQNELSLWAVNRAMFDRFPKYLALLDRLGCPPPYLLSGALLDCNGYSLAGLRARSESVKAIDRSSVILPEIYISEQPSNYIQLLRPFMDGLWQAAGANGLSANEVESIEKSYFPGKKI
jgi:hypothetical protein